MPPVPSTVIFVRVKTHLNPDRTIGPDLPLELLQHQNFSVHSYTPDFTSCVSRIEVDNIKLGAFRAELEIFKSKGVIEEIVPSAQDRLKYMDLGDVIDKTKSKMANAFHERGRPDA